MFYLIQVDDEGAFLWQGCVHLILWNDACTSFGQLHIQTHTNTHVNELETHLYCGMCVAVKALTKFRSFVLGLKPVNKPISKIDIFASTSLFLNLYRIRIERN